MKLLAASIGLGVGLLALALPAQAGPCSGEIETLTQALTTSGTGMGASPGVPAVPAAPHLPKAPDTSGTLPANPLEPGQPPKAIGSNTIPKAPSTAGTLPPNPLESTDASKMMEPGAMTGGSMAGGSMMGGGEAQATLQRARELDQAGDEAGCMAEIAKAKNLIGIQ